MLLGSIWVFFVRPGPLTNYIVGVFCVLSAAFMLRKFAGQSLHCITFRLEIGDGWVASRDISSLEVVPFAKLVGFGEEPLMSAGNLAGYRFGFIGADDRHVLFSTQIVGWAEIIQRVHTACPDRVPAAEEVEAYSIVRSLELSADAAAFTAPPFDTPENWRASSVARWYDFWVGWPIGLAIGWFPNAWITHWLKGEGINSIIVIVITGIPFVLFCQFVAVTIASALRRRRQSK